MEFRLLAFGTRCLSPSLSMPPSVLSSSRHDFSKHSRPLRLFADATIDLRDVFTSPLLFFRASVFEPLDEQLACDPEPDVKVELLLSEELLLNVRIKGFLATGEIGGVEILELMHDSESLSSVAVDVDLPIINDVRGGLTGGVVLIFSSSKIELGADDDVGVVIIVDGDVFEYSCYIKEKLN